MKRQEHLVAAWAALTFGALLASYMAFRPIRDALISRDSDRIVWLFTATLVVVGTLSAVWTHVLGKRRPRRTLPKVFHVFAGCCIVFAILVGNDIAPAATRRVFYVWSGAFNLFVVSVFWTLLADLLGPATAKRLYGPIAAGGTAGAIAGPALTRLLVDTIGIDGVLVMSAVLLELAVIGITQVRHHGEKLNREPDEPTTGGAFRGFRNVARSPYLLGIVAYVLLTATAATFIYLEQLKIVGAQVPDKVEATELYASMELATQVGAFIVQTVLATPLLTLLGPGIVLVLLPLAQGISISTLVASPTIRTLIPIYIGTRVITHGLTRPARELLFTVVSRDDKYQAKHAIDTFGYRVGDFSSAWLYKGLKALGLGSVALVGAMLPISVIWAALAIALGIGYRRRLPK